MKKLMILAMLVMGSMAAFAQVSKEEQKLIDLSNQKWTWMAEKNAVWEFCYHALQFFFPATNTETMTNYYTRQSRISDVMNDPVFDDYGRLIFPLNTGYWSGTTLEQLALTWYNYIDPDKTVEVCNYLRAHALELSKLGYNAFALIYRPGDAGRSFRLGYGNNGFGNFLDYTYNHTFTPSAIESAKADTKSSAEQIIALFRRAEVTNCRIFARFSSLLTV